MKTVLFACVHNAGRSQMAAALFNQLADPLKARALSAGTEPGTRVHPEVIEAMRELGVDLSSLQPQKLTQALAESADLLVTMGCGEACPVVPGVARDDWPLEDPKGKPLPRVREIRSEIALRIRELLAARGWSPWTVRAARPDDRAGAEALLRAVGLPVEGVAPHFDAFMIAEGENSQLIGVAGLERYGATALLRSVAVDSGARTRGLGSLLTQRALADAREHGATAVYLLTTTAEPFFARHGFERIERSKAPPEVARSAEFSVLCPDSAALMYRRV